MVRYAGVRRSGDGTVTVAASGGDMGITLIMAVVAVDRRADGPSREPAIGHDCVFPVDCYCLRLLYFRRRFLAITHASLKQVGALEHLTCSATDWIMRRLSLLILHVVGSIPEVTRD